MPELLRLNRDNRPMSPAEMSRPDQPGKSNRPASLGPNQVLHRQVPKPAHRRSAVKRDLNPQVGKSEHSPGNQANREVHPAAVLRVSSRVVSNPPASNPENSNRADNPQASSRENNPVNSRGSNNYSLSSRNSRRKPHRWRSTRPNSSALTRLRRRQQPKLRRVASRLPRVPRVLKRNRQLSRLARRLRQRKRRLER